MHALGCPKKRLSFEVKGQLPNFNSLKSPGMRKTLGTSHYLYPGLGLKRKCFELKKYIYPTINNQKFSKTLSFISLKNNYPTFANTFVFKPIFSSPLLGILV